MAYLVKTPKYLNRVLYLKNFLWFTQSSDGNSNLLSILFRCGTISYEWDTCRFASTSLLTIIRAEEPIRWK